MAIRSKGHQYKASKHICFDRVLNLWKQQASHCYFYQMFNEIFPFSQKGGIIYNYK